MKSTLRSLSVLVLSVFVFAGAAFSQTTKEAAINAYNAALEAAKGSDVSDAISKFEKCAEIAGNLGDAGSEIKGKAEKQLPGLYYKKATDTYKSRDFVGAIAAFEKAIEIADTYGDSSVRQKSEKNIPVIYTQIGSSKYKAGDYDGAIVDLEKAISLNSNYALAYFNLAQSYLKKGELNIGLDNIDKAIASGEATRKNRVVRSAKRVASQTLVKEGVDATKKRNYSQAVNHLNRAMTYDANSSEPYYRLAEAYNKQAIWGKAIDSANKALNFEKGGRTDRAKIYYELGVALKNQGQKASACEAFTSASYGNFKTLAEHEIVHELKCKDGAESQ